MKFSRVRKNVFEKLRRAKIFDVRKLFEIGEIFPVFGIIGKIRWFEKK
jgi:hypothetical protein